MRVVCLISGRGTNLQALINWQANDMLGGARIVAVISNTATALGLERAGNAKIPTKTLSHQDFPNRSAFDHALIQVIDTYEPDLVALVGFMRILTSDFVTHYDRRLINIHPSLLPKYKGLNTHKRALEAGDNYTGATVHWVTSEVDAGNVIRQVKVPVMREDTEETLKARVLVPNILHPSVIRDLSLVDEC